MLYELRGPDEGESLRKEPWPHIAPATHTCARLHDQNHPSQLSNVRALQALAMQNESSRVDFEGSRQDTRDAALNGHRPDSDSATRPAE